MTPGPARRRNGGSPAGAGLGGWLAGTLHIGFFTDFKGRDTLLLASDGDAVANLLGVLRDLATGARERVRLESLSFAEAGQHVAVLADVQVIVARGEYDDAWWQRHGRPASPP
jgi:hypothetical protein